MQCQSEVWRCQHSCVAPTRPQCRVIMSQRHFVRTLAQSPSAPPHPPITAAPHHSSLPISTDGCSVLLQIITTTSPAAGMLCSVGTAAALGKAALLLFMWPIRLKAETPISLQPAEGGEILQGSQWQVNSQEFLN